MMKGLQSRNAGQIAWLSMAFLLAFGTTLAMGVLSWSWRVGWTHGMRYQAYKDLQRNAGQADSLFLIYATVDKEIQALQTAIPAQNQASYVLQFLVEKARHHGLGIAGVEGLDEVVYPGFTELPFEVGLTGDFSGLLKYVHALETQGMALQVRRLTLQNPTFHKPQMQTRLELSVFLPKAGSPR